MILLGYFNPYGNIFVNPTYLVVNCLILLSRLIRKKNAYLLRFCEVLIKASVTNLRFSSCGSLDLDFLSFPLLSELFSYLIVSHKEMYYIYIFILSDPISRGCPIISSMW